MKVSVIISVYNGADILSVTLPSLLNQDYPNNKMEIIIVDDASTDDTSQLLDSIKQKESIIVFSHTENRGRAATRNSGIKLANGELLIFLDCDIEVNSDFISRHVEYHKNENVTGVVSHLRTHDTKSKDKYHRYIFFGKRGVSIVGGGKPIPFNYFIQTCTSVKADAINETGMYNEELPAYGIDLEYAYRLWKFFPKGLFYAENINVYMYNVHTLEEALSNYLQYGEYNVPIILKQFPELESYVAADFVKSINGKLTWKIFMGSVLINRLIFLLARVILNITPFPLSNYLIRYLLATSTAMGYRKHLKKIN